jgi:uncharacterized membrane protein YedE/YeeE
MITTIISWVLGALVCISVAAVFALIPEQAKWRRIFSIIFGALIWAATFALLEGCVFVCIIWWLWVRQGNDLAGVLALFWCFAAFPFISVAAMPIGLFAYEKIKPADRVRKDG